jgi:hypothetical protein
VVHPPKINHQIAEQDQNRPEEHALGLMGQLFSGGKKVQGAS